MKIKILFFIQMAISITEANTKVKSAQGGSSERNFSLLQFGRRISDKELILFTSQMSLFLESGHSLNKALMVIQPQIQHPYFKEVIAQTLDKIEEGKLFSEALEKYPKVFSPLFISMIKVGEKAGLLKQMMKQLTAYYKQRREYINAIRKALIYPLVLLIFSFLVIVFVMVYIFPKLATLLTGRVRLLPWSTRLLIWLSNFLGKNWHFILIGGLLLGGIIHLLLKRPEMIIWIEKQRMKIPVLKNMLIQFYSSYFLLNLGFLMSGGVPLLEGLIISKSIMTNSLYKKFIKKLITSVEKGAGFSAPFQNESILPISVNEMVQTGEETGNLTQVLIVLGEHYAEEFKKAMELFCIILEPIIIIFMGLIVGTIVLSVIIPIFRLSSGIQ
ncbi:MAG: type II secretion system F family protein [bacterium]